MLRKKVFVTGATGYIGSSVIARLVQLDYEVLGLIRNSKDINRLKKLGVNTLLGTLADAKVLQQGAQWADTVINTADYEHAYAVSTFLDNLANTNKTYIHVSGSSIAGIKSAGEYDSQVFSESNIHPRLEKAQLAAIHNACIEGKNCGIRTIIVAPALIYGTSLGIKTDPVVFTFWGEWAKSLGGTPYLGKGENIWSNVHIQDLTDLVILALEKAESGSIFFAENGQASMKDMAEAINHRHNLKSPAHSLPLETFIEKFGLDTAHTLFGGNSRVDSKSAKELLGWAPKFNNLKEFITF